MTLMRLLPRKSAKSSTGGNQEKSNLATAGSLNQPHHWMVSFSNSQSRENRTDVRASEMRMS